MVRPGTCCLLATLLTLTLTLPDYARYCNTREPSASSTPDVCLTEGCIGAAHMLLQNMNRTADPCEDFYEFACGGFEERVVIPDDRSSRSQFAIIGDELLIQLRGILEAEAEEGESRVFTMARDVYKACMGEEEIEAIGLEPLKEMPRALGGWPVLEGDAWDAEAFSWVDTVYKFRKQVLLLCLPLHLLLLLCLLLHLLHLLLLLRATAR